MTRNHSGSARKKMGSKPAARIILFTNPRDGERMSMSTPARMTHDRKWGR